MKMEFQDVLLAQEKGHNAYGKVDDQTCKLAHDWWAEKPTNGHHQD